MNSRESGSISSVPITELGWEIASTHRLRDRTYKLLADNGIQTLADLKEIIDGGRKIPGLNTKSRNLAKKLYHDIEDLEQECGLVDGSVMKTKEALLKKFGL